MKGYLTLEAACIMPAVLYVYVFIIYMMFFQYNRCLTEQELYRCILRGSQLQHRSSEEVYEEVMRQVKKWDGDRWVALKQPAIKAVVSSNKIKVSFEGSIRFPFKWFWDIRGMEQWDILAQKECGRLFPVNFIRTCRLLERVADEKNGVR